ncbi:Bacitracin resistance protein BacA [Caldicellulosiruptor obsidiansis OB47]|uniref:Undecaprenyl-diphosphatase n=1 Tax=Caldicellulosiruptor obsidiansis (strain ATCC BAA-2073 / JCM 16842 / OB47) TaxID=608506 RepID=D9TFF9_CALOO|nr:undecaprenyl-diphosphatase UppP [Caldicellulosiruptor obsidiansis]ADL42929.1 Bacitracin resistance protein BacA [Caldicellulosiruptor obsidiansis OB47]
MTVFQAIFLGILQGLGEFLPISSSAHLIIFPWFFGWKEHSLVFDVALHLGTLLAVLVYFWKDYFDIVVQGISKPKSEKGKLLWFIIVATIPGALFGYFFENVIENVFRKQYLLIAIVLAVFGFILYYVDSIAKNKVELSQMNVFHAALIGVSQAFALFPGISRSGITMTTGLLLGLKKEAAAKFSFLMSAPIILGAGAVSLLKNINHVAAEFSNFAIGFFTSAIVGFLAIHFLLSIVKKSGFKIFAYYRFFLAAVILAFYLSKVV